MRRGIGNMRQGEWRVYLVLAAVALALVLTQAPALAAAKKALVDINSATEAELEAVKGVGPVTAKKIIANRPYKSLAELSKAGLSAKKIDALKSSLTVGAAPAPAKEAKPAAKEATKPEPVAAKGKEKKAPEPAVGPVDLNSADQKALEALPGIGPALAKKIMEARPFKSVNDLSKVKGMSKAKMDALKGKVTVAAAKPAAPEAKPAAAPPAPQVPPAAEKPAAAAKPAEAEKPAAAPKEKEPAAKLAPGQKVNLNTASKEDLEKLPEIGPVKAQAIIDNRPYAKPEDIMKVKGIKEKTFEQIKDLITVK